MKHAFCTSTRLALIGLLLTSFALAAAPGYHIVKTFKLGGDGGWDYLTFDAAGKRLFISRGTHVMVVDPYKGSVVGDIPNTPGVHVVDNVPKVRLRRGQYGCRVRDDAGTAARDMRPLRRREHVRPGAHAGCLGRPGSG